MENIAGVTDSAFRIRPRSPLFNRFSHGARELGYAPAHTLAGGLRATLDWYLDNTRWWQPLLGRDYAAWVEKNYSR